MDESRDWRARTVAGLVPHVVHRVNNLLSVILGYAELGASAAASEVDRERSATSAEQAREASLLLRALGELAALADGDREPVDVVALARPLECLLQPLAKSARCDLTIRHACASARLEGDSVALANAVFALVQDLLGGPEPDRATLSSRGPGRLRLTLSAGHDGALRMRASLAAEAAAPPAGADFERVAAVARDHGGRARTRSLGTRVRSIAVRLPAEVEADPSALRPPRPPRVVVVERDPGLAELVATVLDEAGYRTRVAPDAAALRAALANETCDLLLCSADAWDRVADDVEFDGPRIEVGSSGAGERGADDVLPKPFGPSELVAKVAALLGR